MRVVWNPPMAAPWAIRAGCDGLDIQGRATRATIELRALRGATTGKAPPVKRA